MLHFIVCKGECQSRKKSAIIIAIFLHGGVGSEVTIALFILILKWHNSSRKIFPFGVGGWGEEGSEEKSCENFLNILTFSREKSVLTKVVPYDARSLKKICLNLSQ